MMRERPDALIVTADGTHELHQARIVEFTVKRQLPALYRLKGYVEVEHHRAVPTQGDVRGQDPERRQARRAPRRAANQVRTGHQPEDGEGPWPHDPVRVLLRVDQIIE